MTPRLKDALAAWDALPVGEPDYAKVAEALGVTNGRAADYVRKALTIEGRESELAGNGRKSKATTPSTPQAVMQQAIDQLRTRIQAEEARASEEFAFRQAEEQRLADRVKQAQADLKAFKDDADQVAAKAAGIPWATPHMLRHGRATQMREHGHDAKDISVTLGHTDPAFTHRVYIKGKSKRFDDLPGAEADE